MDGLNIDLSNSADDDFFGSLKGNKSSKLQQLFVDDALSADNKEQSLKYQPPKDIASSSSATSNTSTTLIAKVVTAYKQGELQGKVGLALIHNPDDVCTIIIYKSKENILATLKLQRGIDSFYKQRIYWQFYDETNAYWSFTFDSTTDEKEFAKNLDNKHITYKEYHESERIPEQYLAFPNFDKVAPIEAHESTTSRVETKNSLVKRMTKLGKPLPILAPSQQTTIEYSDSSDTEVIQTHLAKPSVAPRIKKLTSCNSNQQLMSSFVTGSVFTSNPLESQYMQMLLTEQRTQGSEIRMNMNKLENKIEKVLDKLEFHGRNDAKQNIGKDDEILELEEKLLTLKKENRKLKQNLQLTSLEQSKEVQIQDIFHEFTEDFKKFNIDYKQDVRNVLFELCDKIKQNTNVMQQMEEKIKNHEKTTLELEMSLKKNGELKNELGVVNQTENELRNEIRFLKQKENEFKNQLNEREAETIKQKHEILDLQKKLIEKNQATLENDALIKSIMNNLFVDIADKLNNGNFSNSDPILALIANSIKQETLKTLQQTMKNRLDKPI